MRTNTTSTLALTVLALSLAATASANAPAPRDLMDVVRGEASESGTPLTLTANEPLTLTVKNLAWGPDGPPPKETVALTRRLDKGQSYAFTFLPPGDLPSLALCAKPESGAELCWRPAFSGEDGRLMMDPGFRLAR